MDEVGRLTRRLVSVPSHESETAAGDDIEAWLRAETDADVTRDAVGNVLAWRPPNADGTGDGDETRGEPPSLALVGHHDVVPPDGSQQADGGYLVEERGGRLYGRGTADMKGSLAAAMLAFRDADPSCRLGFASFVGEETGGKGARHAVETGFDPDYAVVGEGSTGYSAEGVTDVAVAHRGRREHEVTVRGSAAHASEPGGGENAVYRACAAVERVHSLDPPATAVLGHRLAGSATVTRVADGGNAANVVPDRCTLTVDERTVPGVDAGVGGVDDLPGVDRTVTSEVPPMACEDAAFARTVQAAAADVQSAAPEQVTKPHATDAGWLAATGTACVVCGAAEPGEAHTATESVSLAALATCRGIYRRVADCV
jgi:acetylornithine deacetylase